MLGGRLEIEIVVVSDGRTINATLAWRRLHRTLSSRPGQRGLKIGDEDSANGCSTSRPIQSPDTSLGADPANTGETR